MYFDVPSRQVLGFGGLQTLALTLNSLALVVKTSALTIKSLVTTLIKLKQEVVAVACSYIVSARKSMFLVQNCCSSIREPTYGVQLWNKLPEELIIAGSVGGLISCLNLLHASYLCIVLKSCVISLFHLPYLLGQL